MGPQRQFFAFAGFIWLTAFILTLAFWFAVGYGAFWLAQHFGVI